jgi:hypothetical protein
VLWKTWAAVGALAIGLLIPTLSGGDSFQRTAPLLLAAVLAGVAATFVGLAGGRRELRPQGLPAADAYRPAESEVSDQAILKEIDRLISERDVEWLRREDFADSWQADHCSQLREVALLEVGQHAIADPELRRGVSHLADAAGVFSHIHVRDTIVDPIMLDPSWRTIGRIGPDGEAETLAGQERRTVQEQLRAAADDVCDGIDEIRLRTGTYVQPPSPQMTAGRLRAKR